jgi:hypothetical protein
VTSDLRPRGTSRSDPRCPAESPWIRGVAPTPGHGTRGRRGRRRFGVRATDRQPGAGASSSARPRRSIGSRLATYRCGWGLTSGFGPRRPAFSSVAPSASSRLRRGQDVAKAQVALRGRLVTQRGNYGSTYGAFTRVVTSWRKVRFSSRASPR